MANPPRNDIVCVVIDLSDRWRTLTTVNFARTYKHAGTVNDLQLNAWLNPKPSHNCRKGLSGRRLLCRHSGPNHPPLINPFSFIFEPSFTYERCLPQTGYVVVAKHATSDDPQFLSLQDVDIDDLDVISRILQIFYAKPTWAMSLAALEHCGVTDRRFLVDRPHRNIPGRCTIHIARGCRSGDLGPFLKTCRAHYHLVTSNVEHRVNRVIRHIVGDDIPIHQVKATLRATGGIIHGAVAQVPLLAQSTSTALPKDIYIATPVATRREWLRLFRRIPDIATYHFWNDVTRADNESVERVRSVFFLPNGIVITLQESWESSALPILLCNGITSLACGIGASSVFSLYPTLLSRSLTHRIFNNDGLTESYVASLSTRCLSEGFQLVKQVDNDDNLLPPSGDTVWRQGTTCTVENCSHLDR
ncbi:hypothetical protein K435DRAFT_851048 [Dendrothele bispora CBS 962.96]|uniref:Uncharacterized protein n=1 Tax=Dendrothele bispora (strain CBS 962.96) TaxID=1314807 RepID=A0A4S8MNV2_DENBC|nr:hypothetical protein K435DRAFT_851048 [Dendrothele bispora CBS 962.96]